jgi:hypothetical protein
MHTAHYLIVSPLPGHRLPQNLHANHIDVDRLIPAVGGDVWQITMIYSTSRETTTQTALLILIVAFPPIAAQFRSPPRHPPPS